VGIIEVALPSSDTLLWAEVHPEKRGSRSFI